MSTDLSDLTADELRDRTREWLADHLPAGWMDAIDAGDTATRRRRAGRARLREVVHRVRRVGVRHSHVAGGVRRRPVVDARARPGR